MKVITESGMNFGKFDEKELFHIENSRIYKELGCGIKTVEFILKQGRDSVLFLEAKTSCPNAANRYESEEKEDKFEEYYTSITEKFIASLQIYLAVILDKFKDLSDVGDELKTVSSLKDIQLKFVLVIKNTKDITWLAGPLAELKARLLQIRKIWNVKIIVLNEELADEYGLLDQDSTC